MDEALLRRLLAPVAADAPAGADLGYTSLFDQIREARHADDPSLAQGDWVATLKVADWELTARLCEEALAVQSKDLRLAAWYVDALAHTAGFDGIAFGLTFLANLLDAHWPQLFPRPDDGDLGERSGRIEWLDAQLAGTVRTLALTSPDHGGYSWHDNSPSHAPDGEGSRPAPAATVPGQPAPPATLLERSAAASGPQWFAKLDARLERVRHAWQGLDASLARHFGLQAPVMRQTCDAVEACTRLAARLHRHGSATPAIAAHTAPPPTAATDQAAPPDIRSAACESPAGRVEAIRQLEEVARYFRHHEPHSPVALLVERAARWAGMSFEEWLQTVIKDGSTLGQLQELLEFRASD
ncbi:hypothetical protein CJ010_08100 [Azoarcus sp. DD4]|uniref:type VI secretion system protein TssA n=1 Tax=Azoarcus sp. DD4 TaxID=2027405 RepID=UPI001127E15A|nr:type VI secretion system protein TssA [Azoarcus sp. DD4]QDF96501.1 hypothetical protein CJ010_08100 [Azoarcus sp. DD4]